MVTAHPVLTVQELPMVMLTKITAEPVIMTAPMIVYKIVQEHGVVIKLMMPVVYVMVMIVHVQMNVAYHMVITHHVQTVQAFQMDVPL